MALLDGELGRGVWDLLGLCAAVWDRQCDGDGDDEEGVAGAGEFGAWGARCG